MCCCRFGVSVGHSQVTGLYGILCNILIIFPLGFKSVLMVHTDTQC